MLTVLRLISLPATGWQLRLLHLLDHSIEESEDRLLLLLQTVHEMLQHGLQDEVSMLIVELLQR